MNKLIVILGPTSSGKTALSIKLAKKFNGEIVSADSRQVYKGMDIGTGKVTPDTKNSHNFSSEQAKKKYIFIAKGIPHYCIDVASPKRKFTVAQYQKLALKIIAKIHKKNKIPFLVGGTGLYIRAVADGLVIPEVKPDWALREKLEQKTTEELFLTLKSKDPDRAKTIDKSNRRRLVRALEIVLKTKKPVPALEIRKPNFETLKIGIKKEPDKLKKLIKERLLKRLKQGLINEVKNLKKSGLSWKRLEEFGLEYRYVALYLQKKLNYQEMVLKLQKEIEHYSKRQMTWFKRDKRIKWVKKEKNALHLLIRFVGML